jgi:uncharacterized membrane protein YbhN (UPF0104 family)
VTAGRPRWRWVRPAAGAAVLAIVVVQVGTGPFLDGLAGVGPASLAVATALTAVATLCCAWRWSLVARGLGVDLAVPAAAAACYRSQLLNATLPGGVLGDVHRAVRHGREAGDLPRSARAVAWERTAGQLVQVALTVLVLLVLASPVRSSAPALALAAAGITVCAVVAVRVTGRWHPGLPGRVARTLDGDVRQVLLARRVWPGVLVASGVAALAHAAVFLVAARTTGIPATTGQLLPLALVVLVVAAVPANLAGWGPREGAAAWAFGAAGLGASQGVTVAAAYGVLALFATLPGLVVAAWPGRRTAAPEGLARG